MHRRLFLSILLALTLAGGSHVVMAAPPLYLVCRIPNAIDLFIVVDSFGGVGGAVKQCVAFWHGFPQGLTSL
jgi:hypothetical protein